MPIVMVCPNPACARRSRGADDLVGKSVRCKACGQSFVATASSGSGSSEARATHPVAADRTLPPGPPAETVGRFHIRGKLGAGAFGTVYRAYDPHLDREVALKVPNPGVLDNPKRVERFLREAKASANLRHPHIVPVYDAGKDGDRYFIASAFIDGKSLADEIPDGGMPFPRAARLLQELASAVAYAHEQGIVHRDIKPANVMVDAAGRPHLMDFGLAARADEESRLTADGAVIGTPAYMAPEQAAGQKGEASPPADQYALGVVLYELLTGTVPFSGPVPVVIHNVLHTEPEPPRTRRADVPKDLETVCLKAMAKRAEDRYPDCQTLAEDLRRWLSGEPIAARRLLYPERFVRWVRKNPAVAGLTVAVAVLLVVGTLAATTLAVQAGAAAREALAARDSAREANDSLALETEKARAAQRVAEEKERVAQTAEADAKRLAAETKLAEEKALKSAAAAKKSQEEAELALENQKKAETRAKESDTKLNEFKVSQEEKEYRFAIAEGARAVEAGVFREASDALSKAPDRLRGPEWKILDHWARVARSPVTEYDLPWYPRTEFVSNEKPQVFPSADGKHVALVLTRIPRNVTDARWGVESRVRVFALNGGKAAERDAFTVTRDDIGGESFYAEQLAFSPDANTVAAVWGLTRIGGYWNGDQVTIHTRAGLRPSSVARTFRTQSSAGLIRPQPDNTFLIPYPIFTGGKQTLRITTLTASDAAQPPDSEFLLDGSPHNTRLSADGRWLALTFWEAAKERTVVLDCATKAEHTLVTGSRRSAFGFSAGGKYLLLTDDVRPPARPSVEVYAAPAAPGDKWTRTARITLSGKGERPLGVSPDGTRILTGLAAGGGDQVRIYDARDGSQLCSLSPFPVPELNPKAYTDHVVLESFSVDPELRVGFAIYKYWDSTTVARAQGKTRVAVWDLGVPAP